MTLLKSKSSYDVIVIGAGSAGSSAALRARTFGTSVCLIEDQYLGGDCPNYACIPSKALFEGTELLRMVRKAKMCGIHISGLEIDFQKMIQSVRKVVDQVTGTPCGQAYQDFFQAQGIHIEFGKAVFEDEHTVIIEKKNDKIRLKAKAFVIATGSSLFIPPIKGITDISFLTYKDILNLSNIPKSLAIIGGGPVGCEFATFFGALGSKVSLISKTTLLDREDSFIGSFVEDQLEKQKVEVFTNTEIQRIFMARGSIYGIELNNFEHQEKTIACERILLATGKHGNILDLNPSKIGLQTTSRGYISVSSKLQSHVKHIFAAGDITGGFQFTHTAHKEGQIAGYNAACIARRKKGLKILDERVVPRVIFVHPEVACVGLSEEEAKKMYQSIRVVTIPLENLGRYVVDREPIGFIKMIIQTKTRTILGAHLIGPRAGDIIHEIALAIHLQIKVDVLDEMIHAFPTYAEAITEAASRF